MSNAPTTAPFSDVTVAAYYYPCTHPHVRWDKAKYKGFTEWDLIRSAKPRFEGHEQPRVPLWGYEDESQPEAMARKIDAAADHGVGVFIFDWYYYNDGPYLEGALEGGFLNAPNNSRIKFCIMWANHEWYDIQGYNPAEPVKLLYPGAVTDETLDKMMDLIIERYFKHPSYWLIDGKPYLSIYDINVFLNSYETKEKAREALDRLRAKTIAAGFPDLHVNCILWGSPNLPGGTTPADWPQLCKDLALDSLTGYTWVHHGALNYDTFPVSDYTWGRDKYLEFMEPALSKYPVPYFPNTTVNWDNSPRAHPDSSWKRPGAHVVNPVMTGNTPSAFKEATNIIAEKLVKAENIQPKVITVNAWNEWPEGSCLEPDVKTGYGYLEAIRELFGSNKT
ncbi:MAG TPA: glycoside hydrolase family 99-like domain-containing protein [Candidatus Methylacidiphilales bacterium]|nr:glycoside hydrolase family 99-like domain-containing protein [Candidatus Methylacidiphilales bacterium]